jgi:hypothetical protein
MSAVRKPRALHETPSLVHPIRAALNAMPGVRVFPNVQGFDSLRKFKYGLGPGSADLVGLVTMAPDTHCMAGPIARLIGIECKMPGRDKANPATVADQERWRKMVHELGGFACVVHSVTEAVEAVARCRAGAVE